MAEFQWWLLLVGLVAGGGLVAVVLMDPARRDEDVEADEIAAEATWIADRLRAHGRGIDPAAVEDVLMRHREYLSMPPPDGIVDESAADGSERVPPLSDSAVVEPRRMRAAPSPSAPPSARGTTSHESGSGRGR
jgi:hypothetical protein